MPTLTTRHPMRGVVTGLVLAVGLLWLPLIMIVITAIVWAR